MLVGTKKGRAERASQASGPGPARGVLRPESARRQRRMLRCRRFFSPAGEQHLPDCAHVWTRASSAGTVATGDSRKPVRRLAVRRDREAWRPDALLRATDRISHRAAAGGMNHVKWKAA